MKKINQYWLIPAILLFMMGAGGCSDDYEYSSDYSSYENATLKVALVNEDNVLELNLINGTHTLTMEVTPESLIIDPAAYIYKVSDETVATVDNEGTLTMLKEGETDLTVTFRGNHNLSTTCKVTIAPILTEALDVPELITVEEEKTYDLASNITVTPSQASHKFVYTSSDEGVVMVDENGIVTGIKEGNASITVATTDGTNLTETIPVEVVGKIYITEIKLPTDKVSGKTFVVGQSFSLSAQTTIIPSNASEPVVTYSLKSGEGVASVTEDGIVTALSAGSATILAEAQDDSGITAEITVTIGAGEWFERALWSIDTNFRSNAKGESTGEGVLNYVPDGSTGLPEHMLDGNASTYFALVKPEKGNYNGYVNRNTEHYFIVDMGAPCEFNEFKWRHRNTTRGMQVHNITLYGSNDGSSFEEIKANIDLAQSPVEQTFDLPLSTYRYIKAQFNEWDPVNNYNVTVAEFNVGKK